MIAAIAARTGIPPNALLETDLDILEAIIDHLTR